MRVLAIESSCDETGVAVVESDKNGRVKVLGSALASSEGMHEATGGVVPEVAAREQLASMVPVLGEALASARERAGFTGVVEEYRADLREGDESRVEKIKGELSGWAWKNIDRVAVTTGPGLIGSLLVGVETAKGLSYSWKKPLVAVNHVAAHLYANLIEKCRVGVEAGYQPLVLEKEIEFPALGLVVSGGHTEFVLMEDVRKLKLLGATRDDAAGECLDKCGRLLGLPYPAGAMIEKLSENFLRRNGETNRVLPRPLIDELSPEMSFSGLKVAVSREIEKRGGCEGGECKEELAAEILEAVVEVIEKKAQFVLGRWQVKSFLIGGGVAANRLLRERLARLAGGSGVGWFEPDLRYCRDNAVMVGTAGVYGAVADLKSVRAEPGLRISTD